MSYKATTRFADMLKSNAANVAYPREHDIWFPARPEDGLEYRTCFAQRIRHAWAVFTGRADALYWVRQ
jgi:hypothetical protein